ncbi:SPOSA6832_01737 [Sporobolomyces salmonicolor]|uniref:SPOSA6832_01737-mRNA-1:cds n=1 Tax=Sporidiobolus salmonicolor TaxID=5005 RepID=A0A0D6EJH1_SPOSA|nr:SPOSA6832_01737 [Sporobolomyces salmonicolor]
MSSQGDQLRQKADKKASSSSGFSLFSSSSAKFEEAHDLYTSAGNAYRVDKRFKDAGDCFCKAAEMALKQDEKDDAASDFWTASKCYKKSHPELAVAALQKTIQLYKEKGRFRQAADREKEIASILQQEGGDLAGALEAYEAAGDLFSSEDASASANACFKEAAELAATLGQFPRAVKHFESVAAASLGSALTRYGVKEYYMKAAMCWLATAVGLFLSRQSSSGGHQKELTRNVCQDVVSTKRAIDTYCNADPTFATTRECKFVNLIADAFDAGDAEEFTAAVAEYDRLTKLDQWKTGILLTIKRQIAEEPSLT